MQVHGFYVDKSKSNVYFDLVVDFDEKDKQQLQKDIVEKLKLKYPNYNFNVILDSDVSD